MARKKHTVKLGQHKRNYLDVVIPIETLVTNDDGSLVLDEEAEPVTETTERTYHVPLRDSLTIGEMLLFRQADGASNLDSTATFAEFLSRHIPRDVVEGMDSHDIETFYDAWDSASTEDEGLTQGE